MCIYIYIYRERERDIEREILKHGDSVPRLPLLKVSLWMASLSVFTWYYIILYDIIVYYILLHYVTSYHIILCYIILYCSIGS